MQAVTKQSALINKVRVMGVRLYLLVFIIVINADLILMLKSLVQYWNIVSKNYILIWLNLSTNKSQVKKKKERKRLFKYVRNNWALPIFLLWGSNWLLQINCQNCPSSSNFFLNVSCTWISEMDIPAGVHQSYRGIDTEYPSFFPPRYEKRTCNQSHSCVMAFVPYRWLLG